MWEYRHTPSSNELCHYGVLGMKWGVRKDPSKAYRKASKKLDRLKKKTTKRQAKATKKQNKAIKAARRTYSWNPFKYSSSQIGSKAKIAARATKKAEKTARKTEKWEEEMTKTFSQVKISQISQKDLEAGRNYINMLRKR